MEFIIALGIATALGGAAGPLYHRGGAARLYVTATLAAAALTGLSLALRTAGTEVSRSAQVGIACLPIAAGAIGAHLVARDGEGSLRGAVFTAAAGFVGAAAAAVLAIYAGWVII
jgi:hypothetical protein